MKKKIYLVLIAVLILVIFFTGRSTEISKEYVTYIQFGVFSLIAVITYFLFAEKRK